MRFLLCQNFSTISRLRTSLMEIVFIFLTLYYANFVLISDTHFALPVKSNVFCFETSNFKFIFYVRCFTVQRIQLGPSELFLPITRRVQNKRIRLRFFQTKHNGGKI